MTETTYQKLDLESAFHHFDGVPEEAIQKTNELMRNGKMFRYAYEDPEESPAVQFERALAKHLGVRFALGTSSCTSSIEVALAAKLTPGDTVLVGPAFTFKAVPSGPYNVGMKVELVETDDNYCIDIDDLERKLPRAKALVLSYMRGHIPADLKRIVELCKEHDVFLLEDAAHALGSKHDGQLIGTFGDANAVSFQANKIDNAGEGGALTTNDEELMVKAIFLSGSYDTFYLRHGVKSDLFAELQHQFPLMNKRITNTAAIIAQSQLGLIEKKAAGFRKKYQLITSLLKNVHRIVLPRQSEKTVRVPDSLQFRIPSFSDDQMRHVVRDVKAGGVPLSCIGIDKANVRAFYNWKFLGVAPRDLPKTAELIRTTCDVRLTSALTEDHLVEAANVILDAIQSAS